MRIVLLILLGLLGMVFFLKSCESCIDKRGWVKNKMIHFQYHGKIVKKFYNPDAKMQPYITLDDGSSYGVYNEIYESFQIGDYIIKEKGRIDFKWINGNNDTVVYYCQCNHLDIKE